MRYEDANIENVAEVLTNALKEANRDKKGLFVFGGTGTGKTYFLHAVKNKAKNTGKTLRVVNWLEFISEARYTGNLRTPIDVMNNITDRTGPILIDDVGTEKSTEFAQEMFYMIVNRVYEQGKSICITTNLDLKDFRDKYGDRVLSRIAEMTVMVELKGEDRRITK